MGYAFYEIYRNGEKIQAGYSVAAVCEEIDEPCTAEIHRGFAYLCGAIPGGDQHGCGGYFCGQHLYGVPAGEPGEGRCKRCRSKAPGYTAA